MGVTRTATYIDPQGVRASTEVAYLTREVLARPNLEVMCGAHVTKIRFNDSKRPVESSLQKHELDPSISSALGRSAGAVNTPQKLLLSDIEPHSKLSKHSIPIIKTLPGVGRNLAGHIVFNSSLPARPSYHTGQILKPKNAWQKLSMARAVAQYMICGTGPLTMHAQEGMAFVRVGGGELVRKLGGAPEGGSEVVED